MIGKGRRAAGSGWLAELTVQQKRQLAIIIRSKNGEFCDHNPAGNT